MYWLRRQLIIELSFLLFLYLAATICWPEIVPRHLPGCPEIKQRAPTSLSRRGVRAGGRMTCGPYAATSGGSARFFRYQRWRLATSKVRRVPSWFLRGRGRRDGGDLVWWSLVYLGITDSSLACGLAIGTVARACFRWACGLDGQWARPARPSRPCLSAARHLVVRQGTAHRTTAFVFSPWLVSSFFFFRFRLFFFLDWIGWMEKDFIRV